MAYPELKSIPVNELYLKVNRALYSLKQSPLNWLQDVRLFFDELELLPLDSDPNLFVIAGKSNTERVYILLFIDDILIYGRRAKVNRVKRSILAR